MGISGVVWIVIGFIGQAIFAARFLVQWLYSEYRKRSTFPMLFWYASIIGGTILLCYAIHKRDPVFILGQAGGLVVYVRNLQWRLRERRDASRSDT
ncbi:lipid-A-disaccharide synthase N-terminal domain-containing protein [Oleiagrimonas sp.]|jgi:lipid-A-disaccharide synthase-like uncharacterized protein|uniref:lipid-A-disaccharide synthase N-terminal domain-containing protein n=1 Tax=Oleiagrimonas sp. TaxID=2010330 RepID=UPI00263A2080|nr:lipid-A-disaccharide synthase N-terminal domain-containing protein [Oleiagrimonas sp.]MDA3913720.1 lipid-A-disaccharide synthase N-terminal domain-containing protein [Oleiagrimonas sp.]